MAQCKKALGDDAGYRAELETPPPTVINAYAKFAGENSAMERAAKAREQAGALKKLLEEIEK